MSQLTHWTYSLHPRHLPLPAMSRLQVLLVVVCAVAVSRAQLLWPLYHLPLPITSTQYHAQDSLGQFHFGYASSDQARTESRLADGSVRGSYSYVDPTNQLVRVVYVADADGFRVLEGNNLPTVPKQPPAVETPRPVEYTPEVAAARAEFEKAYNELAAQAAEDQKPEDNTEDLPVSARRKRSAILPALFAISPASFKVKVTEGEEVKDVMSPAHTKSVEYKEVEKTVALPPLVVAQTHGPLLPLRSLPLYWTY